MGLESQIKLPVIEFSEENLKPGSSAWASACIEVRRALEEYGCFEAEFEKMPRRIHDAAFAGAEELFRLPTEVKMRNTSTKPYFEYFGQYKTLPLYESMAIDHPTSLDAATNFTNLMWPAGNDRFRESAQSYSELVTELDRTVARMLFESYGVGYYHDYYSKNTNYLLRYIKYNEPEMEQSNEGLLPHADKTFFSIIHQGKVSGLQVKVKDDQWIDVPPSPTSFIFMAGEALMAWSNDRIASCYHQVILKEKGTRYSLGTFSFITGTVHILEELVDETHPIKYNPFDHFEFLHFVKQNLGTNSNPCLIKAFSGL
ncbi:hypothetical protein like AT1G52800 [Hibiscus trionum]|uniref:Fe2OG dioxygenase domain-containing protein n=1 Tax=Hibiscus trionum TaxID=183268 RepID=A0A9W7J2A9_HIBTR|nr:hypothetical protein like AT1G52800 [Hibiscus trionum]GMJ06816.1 hypothetical protein like AT1G52800 [Hibiscus trionum]